AAGCAPKAATPDAKSPEAIIPALVPSDTEFPARAHHALLTVDRGSEAKAHLAGVVQYQLRRAEALFAHGYPDAGEAVASGALLLLRHDDAIASALQSRDEALLACADAAARRGNAGRARALYELTRQTAGQGERRQLVDGHLRALQAFEQSTESSNSVLRAGDAARERLAAAWVDPSQEAYKAAQASLVAWMLAALDSQVADGEPESRLERDEAVEAYRAVRSGAPSLIALGLRHGEPLSAIQALDEADLSRALPPGVRLRLEAAGNGGSSEAWLDLFRLFEAARQADAESSLPPHVASGAAFWSTLGLYRASPGKLEHAMPLAMSLLEFGMPEVASTLLSQNLDQRVSAEGLSWSLALVLRGLIELSQTEQTEAAERSVEEARPLLDLAEQPRFAGLRPEPARVHALLASIEIRANRLDRAMPLLERAVARTPMADALVRLASLERQRGDRDGAIGTLERAVNVAQRSGEILVEAHAESLRFEIEREAGKTEQARATLARALDRAQAARKTEGSNMPAAAAERLFARVLEYYGDARGARRAYERALEASRGNPIETEVTLTDMARGALVLGDVRLSRAATRAALDAGMKPRDLIYIALWQRLTEQRAGAPSDGLPLQVFTTANDATGWNAQLQRFALGQQDGVALERAARTQPEKTEAEFYRSLTGKPRGPLDGETHASMQRVADSTAIDLIEVKIARDLLAPTQTFTLPAGVHVP
ncbi:MAG TPA: hypothetical protein VLC09_04610, partial [Polyangiaceae bacterium]|nr:hypothetical protein [Polyangiaceae bacterium]